MSNRDQERRLRCIEIASIIAAASLKNVSVEERLITVMEHAKRLHDFVVEKEARHDS